MNSFTKTRHVSPKDKVKYNQIIDILKYQINPSLLDIDQLTKYFRIGSSFLTTGMISPDQLNLLKHYGSIKEEDFPSEEALDLISDDLDNESSIVQDYIGWNKFRSDDDRDL